MPTGTDEELERLSPRDLIAIIRHLEARIADQDRRIAILEEEQREAKRAKAPFSKGSCKASPIKRFTVAVGRCPLCGWVCRGEHPELGATQNGATSPQVQVGPQVKAQALALHYLNGLPLGIVPGVIEQTTGIRKCSKFSLSRPKARNG